LRRRRRFRLSPFNLGRRRRGRLVLDSDTVPVVLGLRTSLAIASWRDAEAHTQLIGYVLVDGA